MSWEVPTMKSATSFFNGALFRSNLRRFWPLWAGYALMWLVVLPLPLLTRLARQRGVAPYQVLSFQRDMLGVCVTGGHLFAIVFGIFFAMAMFSYLTNPRATGGLHALPARRETLYATDYLTGLFCMLTAQVLAIALTGLVFVGTGAPITARTLGLALCSSTLSTLFFYSFGVFCVMFTGQILAAPVFYGILNLLAVGMEQLVYGFAGNMLYGYSSSFSDKLGFLSPPYEILSRAKAEFLYADSTADKLGDPVGVTVEGLGVLALYALAGLVLAVLGLVVYKRRHSEATGSTVAIGWARPIFKYGVAFCSAFSLGQLFYFILFGQYYSNGSYPLAGVLGCMAFAGLLGYFVAEMLLKKSFHVFRRSWIGAAVVAAVLLAMGVGMSLDLTGFERRMPAAEELEDVSVRLSGASGWGEATFTPDDAASLDLVYAAHRAVIADKARQQRLSRMDGPYDGEIEQLSLGYRLKDGRVIQRQYTVYVTDADLRSPDSPYSCIDTLQQDPAFAYSRVFCVSREEVFALQPYIAGAYLTYRGDTGQYSDTQLTLEQARSLVAAAISDIEAGRVTRSLTGEPLQTRYEMDVYAVSYAAATREDGSSILSRGGMNLIVFDSMSETLALLESMDLN